MLLTAPSLDELRIPDKAEEIHFMLVWQELNFKIPGELIFDTKLIVINIVPQCQYNTVFYI